MFKKLIITFALLLALVLPVIDTVPALAATSTSIVDTSDAKYIKGDYTVDDIVLIAVRASQWILGIVGSLALLMFVYGGIMFLVSAGSSDKISKARGILVAAVVGLAIVFCSYLIIKFVLSTIGITWNGGGIK